MFVIVMRSRRRTKMNKFVGCNSYYLPHFCNLLTFNDFCLTFDLIWPCASHWARKRICMEKTWWASQWLLNFANLLVGKWNITISIKCLTGRTEYIYIYIQVKPFIILYLCNDETLFLIDIVIIKHD